MGPGHATMELRLGLPPGPVCQHLRLNRVLRLQQLERLGPLTPGGHHPQRSRRVSEQDPRLGTVQKLSAAIRQPMEELDHVELRDHRVGQLHKRLDDPLLSGHITHPCALRIPPGDLASAKAYARKRTNASSTTP